MSANASSKRGAQDKLTSSRRLVIKQDTIHSKDTAVTKDDGGVVAVKLGHRIRRPGVEGRLLILDHGLLDVTVHLGTAGIIEANFLGHSQDLDCFEDTQCPESVNIACRGGCGEGQTDVRLSSKMVDLVRVGVTENLDETETVENITIVVVDCASGQAPGRLLGADFGMVANKAMHGVTFFQEQFTEIAPVLAVGTWSAMSKSNPRGLIFMTYQ